jgi:hypothetical protein
MEPKKIPKTPSPKDWSDDAAFQHILVSRLLFNESIQQIYSANKFSKQMDSQSDGLL